MEPALDDDVTAGELDAAVRRDLRGLQKDTAETVARHLVAAGSLVDDDPGQALEHARYARHRASRIAVVREAAGIAAYHAGEWNEALGELRAARRMGGGPGHLAVMADIERALGRPERAIELSRGPEAAELDRAAAIELAIVAAGARRDLGELDAAVVGLQVPELAPARRDPWSARLFYAYADNLLAVGRASEAEQWFLHAADADDEGTTDAARRLAELSGEPLPDDDDVVFGDEAVPVDARTADDEPAAVAADEVTTPTALDEVSAGDAPTSDAPTGDEPATAERAGDEPAGDHASVTDLADAPAPTSDEHDRHDRDDEHDDVPSSAADPVSDATAEAPAEPGAETPFELGADTPVELAVDVSAEPGVEDPAEAAHVEEHVEPGGLR